jgi:hypothetical protein
MVARKGKGKRRPATPRKLKRRATPEEQAHWDMLHDRWMTSRWEWLNNPRSMPAQPPSPELRPEPQQPATIQPTMPIDCAIAALNAIFPNGLPPQLKGGRRIAGAVAEWYAKQSPPWKSAPNLERTVGRAIKRIRDLKKSHP